MPNWIDNAPKKVRIPGGSTLPVITSQTMLIMKAKKTPDNDANAIESAHQGNILLLLMAPFR